MTIDEPALVRLGAWLRAQGYHFTTVTPETHRRVLARDPRARARDLRDALGWSRPFAAGDLPGEAFALLRAAGALVESADGWRSAVRWSSVGDALYAHSAYPTLEPDAVFFGPDTYRFLALLAGAVRAADRVVDVGCGSGAGGLSLAGRCGRVVLGDINDRALAFARVNAALAGVAAEVVRSDVLAGVDGDIDLVIANPPYLTDDERRLYRDGGDGWGTALAVRIVRDALARLAPGGRLIVYTGAPIVDGVDRFRAAVAPLVAQRRATAGYRELDPDVFGEELDRPAYAAVERIAVVALEATVPADGRA